MGFGEPLAGGVELLLRGAVGDQDFEQAFVVVISGEVDGLEIVVGRGVDRETGVEHVGNRPVVLHPGRFGEQAVVLFGERRGRRGIGGLVPELVEPVIELCGFGGGLSEVRAAEPYGLAPGGVVVDVDDVRTRSVTEEKVEHRS